MLMAVGKALNSVKTRQRTGFRDKDWEYLVQHSRGQFDSQQIEKNWITPDWNRPSYIQADRY